MSEWPGKSMRSAAGKLNGHPAFILGRGRGLPDDLTPLDGLFTVGVNTVIRRYEPTVLMWLDAEVPIELGWQLDGGPETALGVTRQEINWDNRWVGLEPAAMNEALDDPSRFADLNCTGASAAIWALALGCETVYLLGFGGDGRFDEPGYVHHRASRAKMDYALQAVRRMRPTRLIHDADQLARVAARHEPMGREWYVDRIGLHPRQ